MIFLKNFRRLGQIARIRFVLQTACSAISRCRKHFFKTTVSLHHHFPPFFLYHTLNICLSFLCCTHLSDSKIPYQNYSRHYCKQQYQSDWNPKQRILFYKPCKSRFCLRLPHMRTTCTAVILCRVICLSGCTL